jgi:hypothetical protein
VRFLLVRKQHRKLYDIKQTQNIFNKPPRNKFMKNNRRSIYSVAEMLSILQALVMIIR